MHAFELHPRQEFEALVAVERPSPPLGSQDLRVRVRAVSLNYRDLTIARGAQRRNAASPVVPASDGAGEVIEAGRAATRFKVGDKVAAIFFPDWIDGGLTAVHHARALGGS